jgi:hypothetical protein
MVASPRHAGGDRRPAQVSLRDRRRQVGIGRVPRWPGLLGTVAGDDRACEVRRSCSPSARG